MTHRDYGNQGSHETVKVKTFYKQLNRDLTKILTKTIKEAIKKSVLLTSKKG